MCNINILIADNENKDLDSIRKEVSKTTDIKIKAEFNNGYEILEYLKTNTVDVIVCGLFTSYIDSITLLEKIKRIDAEKRPQVIVISSASDENIISQVMNNGAYYFLLKPFDTELLLNRIRDSYNNRNMDTLKITYLSESNNPDILEVEITSILKKVGTPPHLKGYWFLKEALLIASNDEYSLKSIAKHIYPVVANKYSTTSSKVERGIRRAIEITCTRGDKYRLSKIFRIKDSDFDNIKITNYQFISTISRDIVCSNLK